MRETRQETFTLPHTRVVVTRTLTIRSVEWNDKHVPASRLALCGGTRNEREYSTQFYTAFDEEKSHVLRRSRILSACISSLPPSIHHRAAVAEQTTRVGSIY